MADAEPGESVARWLEDGRAFFTSVRLGATAFRIFRIDASTGKRSVWREIQPPDAVGVTMQSVALTPDGGTYVYSYQRDLSDLYLMSGLK